MSRAEHNQRTDLPHPLVQTLITAISDLTAKVHGAEVAVVLLTPTGEQPVSFRLFTSLYAPVIADLQQQIVHSYHPDDPGAIARFSADYAAVRAWPFALGDQPSRRAVSRLRSAVSAAASQLWSAGYRGCVALGVGAFSAQGELAPSRKGTASTHGARRSAPSSTQEPSTSQHAVRGQQALSLWRRQQQQPDGVPAAQPSMAGPGRLLPAAAVHTADEYSRLQAKAAAGTSNAGGAGESHAYGQLSAL